MTFENPVKVTVLVSGEGTLLQALIDAAGDFHGIVRVVADHECPALARAEEAGIPTSVVPLEGERAEWDGRLAEEIAGDEPDVVVCAGFMKILGQRVLERFEGRIINSHPALLPAFRGEDAVGKALRYGVKVTGCTIHFVDEGVDTGPIIAQEAVHVEDWDDQDTLHGRIKAVEHRLLVDVVRGIYNQTVTLKEAR